MTVQEAPARRLMSLAKMVWLNAYFGASFLLVSLAFGFGGGLFSLGHFLLFRNKRRTLRVFRRTISHYGTAVCNCGWPLVRVKYVDHSPHENPPFIFVSNHRSASDAFLMSCLPFECVQVVNIWPYKIPLVWLIGTIAGYLRVREMPFDEFLNKGAKLLNEGVSIIAFPEGTRSGSRRMGPFHGSAFRLARATGAKIVPLAISGNENIPKRGSVLLQPGRIIVRKLPAIKAEQYANMTPYQLKTFAREMIQDHLDIEGDRLIHNHDQKTIFDPLPADVAELIPHGRSIRLVDRLIQIGEECTQLEMTIRDDSPLIDTNGRLDELAYVEMIAQSFAARHRFELTPEQRQKEAGFLLGVKNLVVFGDAHVGDRLTIEIQKVARFGDFGIVEGEVRHDDGKLLASGQLKIWRSSDFQFGKEHK